MECNKLVNCPKEIIKIILQFLDNKKDVLRASLVCHDFNNILERKKSLIKFEKVKYATVFIPSIERVKLYEKENEKYKDGTKFIIYQDNKKIGQVVRTFFNAWQGCVFVKDSLWKNVFNINEWGQKKDKLFNEFKRQSKKCYFVIQPEEDLYWIYSKNDDNENYIPLVEVIDDVRFMYYLASTYLL